MNDSRSALLFGATGLVGAHVLNCLLADPHYTSVTILVRRRMDIESDKLRQIISDFEHLPDSAGDWQADDVFACLGTTIAVAGSREQFRRVDHDYTVDIARLARVRGAARLALVSSVGASEKASSFYLRVKGETEREVRALEFESVDLFRPSLLVGARTERRRGEAAAITAMGALSFAMVGGLSAYRPIKASCVACAMVAAALRATPGVRVREYRDIMALCA